MARRYGVVTLVDAAQHVPHEPTDVQAWGADFVAFSGHKMLGPTGIGVLHGRMELFEKMPPFLGGGNMIERVGLDGFTPGEIPARFEAGTPPIIESIGLRAAIRYLDSVGMDRIHRHEQLLSQHMFKQLESQIGELRVLGPRENRAAIFSFVVEGVNPQDLAKLLDFQGIAIRAGHHCAMPLHDKLGIRSSSRASLYLYNSTDEIDYFVQSLRTAIGKLR
jgi:cysteine desulfurase/selenocysteine lyase